MNRLLAIALCTLLSCVYSIVGHAANFSTNQHILSFGREPCPHGLHHQPKGAFAVIVFCEDALGNSLAVVCFNSAHCDRLSVVKNSGAIGWKVSDRVWQQAPWAVDVTSIAWAPDGKYLYVATENPYGAGGLFQLDLYHRTHTQILPKHSAATIDNPGPGYRISGLSEDGKTMRVESREAEHSDKLLTETVTLPP